MGKEIEYLTEYITIVCEAPEPNISMKIYGVDIDEDEKQVKKWWQFWKKN